MPEVYYVRYNNCPDYAEDLNEIELCAFSNKEKAQEVIDILNKEDITKEEIVDILKKYTDKNDTDIDYIAGDMSERTDGELDRLEDFPDSCWYIFTIKVFD